MPVRRSGALTLDLQANGLTRVDLDEPAPESPPVDDEHPLSKPDAEMDESSLIMTIRPGLSAPRRANGCDLMNNPSTSETGMASDSIMHLLEIIKAVRSIVGDGLNDDEFTRLLREMSLPSDAGFSFLSYSGGIVTLTVPQQNLANWYPEKGWIAADKERLAREIAGTYQLSLFEPPDQSTRLLVAQADSSTIHHHLELSNETETVVVAHPRYLKVRLFGNAPAAPYKWLLDLLRDLSALYQA